MGKQITRTFRTKVASPQEIADYYADSVVAEQYIKKRFTDPLNIVEHKKQVKILNSLIAKTNSRAILEFASGPARITSELNIENGTSIDISKSMLNLARQKMIQKGKTWNFIEGDIFSINFSKQLDLIFAIRFFLHFKTPERRKAYARARALLKDGGYLIFEVMNRNTVLVLRTLLNRNRYFVYDKLYTKPEFVKEMEESGFKVISLHPVLSHFWLQAIFSRPFKLLGMPQIAEKIIWLFEPFQARQPYEWIVLCQKK